LEGVALACPADVMNRTRWLVLRAVCSLRDSGFRNSSIFDITLENIGSVRVTDFALAVALPAPGKLEPKVQGFDHVYASRIKESNQDLILRGPLARMPAIFPKDSLTVTRHGVHFAFLIRCSLEELKEERICWIVYADDSPPRSGDESLWLLLNTRDV